MTRVLDFNAECLLPGRPDESGTTEQQLESLRDWANKMSTGVSEFMGLFAGGSGIEGEKLEDLGITTGKIADNAVSNVDISVETGSTKLAGVFTVVLDKTFDVPIDGTYKFSQVSNVTNLVGSRKDFDVRTFQVNAITNLLPSATVELARENGNAIIRVHGADYTGWNTSYVDKFLLFDFDNGGSNPYHFYIVNDSSTDEVFIKATGGGSAGGWHYNTANEYTDIKLKANRDLFYNLGKSNDGANGATCRIDVITSFTYIGFSGSYAVDHGRDFSIAAKTDVALTEAAASPRYIFGVGIENPVATGSSGTVSAYLEWLLMKK